MADQEGIDVSDLTDEPITPTTEWIRELYLSGRWDDKEAEAEFDRWLSGIRADAQTPYEYGLSWEGREADVVWDDCPVGAERANLEEDGFGQLMRRRKAGPWEAVPAETAEDGS